MTTILLQLYKKNLYCLDDFLEKRIPLSGEVPTWSKGQTSLYFNNMCPEVNLFDNLNGLPFSKGLATTDGDWDYERNTEKLIGIKYKHYTECTEYNTYIFTNKKNPKASVRRRSPISKTLRFEIHQEIIIGVNTVVAPHKTG